MMKGSPMMPMINVLNMPSGAPFLPNLTHGLKDRFGETLTQALILLPTRRAVRAMRECFINDKAAQLPRMRPLADINPEEPPFEPGDLASLVPPAIPSAQRRFEMARLIGAYYKHINDAPMDASAWIRLADPLLSILDDAAMREVHQTTLGRLDDIATFAAAHFQNAAKLYEIVQTLWPARLQELGMIDPMQRRVELLKALNTHWIENPPDYPIIIAGSTGTLPATARLIRTVAHMPKGLVVLPGLDMNIRDDAVWNEIDDRHPQCSLKHLIETIGLERKDVTPFPLTQPRHAKAKARRAIISESLVPVNATDDWPGRIKTLRSRSPEHDPFIAGLEGLSFIETKTDTEEARVIALIMRESLETPDQSCAFITPDPALARSVKAALKYWNINVDYSQGEPLEETLIGRFLLGLLNLACDPKNNVLLATLFNHPLFAMGQPIGEQQNQWQNLERRQIRKSNKSNNITQIYDKEPCLKALYAALAPFTLPPFDGGTQSACDWSRVLCQIAEDLAQTDKRSGQARLWVQDMGESAADLIRSLITYGDILGEMDIHSYKHLFSTLCQGRVVRARFGTHPRLKILGPIEARMLHADKLILGGLNEGIWPAAPAVQPFLSPGMKGTLGLTPPERRYGLSAHDFQELANHPDVILTRAKRVGDSPRVASRWLWRLQTLMTGALGETHTALDPTQPYLAWADAVNHVKAHEVRPDTPPSPAPPKDARWPAPTGRRISVTGLRTLIRDPYAHYARKILKLEKLDDLGTPRGPREWGNAIHKALEAFCETHPTLPENAKSILIETFKTQLQTEGVPDHHIHANLPRLDNIALKVIRWLTDHYQKGWEQAIVEDEGTCLLNLPGGDFTLTAKPDRIDRRGGEICLSDYKTGSPPSTREVQAGFDPQLGLTAHIILQGGFKSLQGELGEVGEVSDLIYLQLKGFHKDAPQTSLVKKEWDAARYALSAKDITVRLLNNFDDPDMPYHSQPRAKFTNIYGDYDHLARRDEWAKDNGEGTS